MIDDNSTPSPPAPGRTLFDAVLWDYDGTLVDTRSTDEEAVAELVRGDPGAAAGVPAFWATEGRPLLERLELAWPGRAAEVLVLFDGDAPPRLYPGVRRTAEALRRGGVRQGIVSSRRLLSLRRGLAASGLDGLVTVAVGLESVLAPKPDPEGLLIALRALEVSPARALYVGDRDLDLEAGRRAGVTVWRAAWSHPASARTTHDLRRPTDVLARLGGLAATG